MTVRLIVNMEAATGKREELAATFASLCPSVREEPGCGGSTSSIRAPSGRTILC